MSTPQVKGKKRKKGETQKSDNYYDEEGDLEMISSDGIAFKFPAFYLQAASDMIKLGVQDSKPIQLCDPEIESAFVLAKVLDIVIKNAPFLMTDGMLRRDILKFMQKYDFQRDLAHISKALKLEVGGDIPGTIFASASYMGDWKLCGSIIAGCHLTWIDTGDDMDDFGEALEDCDVSDVRSWSLEDVQQLPPAVLWALSRASMRGERLHTVEARAKAISGEFMRLMTLKGAPKSGM